MYPKTLPDDDKLLWTHRDCFNDQTNVMVRGSIHKNYKINMHTHDFYELNLVLKGKGVHYFSNNKFLIEEGDLFVIPPGYKHGYYMLQELDVYHLLIHNSFFIKYHNDLELLPSFLMLLTVEPVFRKDLNLRYFLKLNEKAANQVVPYLLEISNGYGDNDIEKQVLINSLTLHVIAVICMLYREQYSIMENTQRQNFYFYSIVRSLEMIQQNYSNKLTIENLIKTSLMSRSTFLRFFFKATGYTPGEYIKRYRIGKAKELLINSDIAISEIAQQTGFYDSSHFNRSFKKYIGISPQMFRLQWYL